MPKTLGDYANSTAKTKEKKDKTPRLEGSLSLMPDCEYAAGASYTLSGLGSVFDGDYKFKKVTHTFTNSGYSVAVDVYRRLSGTSGATNGGDTAEEAAATPRREAAQTTLADDESYVTVDKETGEVSY